MSRVSRVGTPLIPCHCIIALLHSEAGQATSDIQGLTEAREKCKAERDALNAKGGQAESPEHLEFEAKSLKVIACYQEIKRLQANFRSMLAQMTSDKKRAEEFAEECDKEHGPTYALWPLGDCGCLLPEAQIFVKSMCDEKDREQFLQDSTSRSMAEYSLENSTRDVLCTTIKKTIELQENGTLPTDATSKDRARTRTQRGHGQAIIQQARGMPQMWVQRSNSVLQAG